MYEQVRDIFDIRVINIYDDDYYFLFFDVTYIYNIYFLQWK